MKKWLPPLILAIAFYMESVFVQYVPPDIFHFPNLLVPHFLIIFFVMMGIFYFRNLSIVYAAVFGLIYDIYYTEIIGIYFFLFPICVYLASKIARLLYAHIFTTIFATLFCISIVEFVVYGFYLFVMQNNIELEDFLSIRFWPTLALNGIVLLFVYYPFKKILLTHKE